MNEERKNPWKCICLFNLEGYSSMHLHHAPTKNTVVFDGSDDDDDFLSRVNISAMQQWL